MSVSVIFEKSTVMKFHLKSMTVTLLNGLLVVKTNNNNTL